MPPENPPPPKSSLYSRFIPREELSSFEAWAPGALSASGGAPSNPRSGVSAANGARADADPAAPLRAARQAGYQDGYRDGLVALEGFKQGFAQTMTAQIGALLASVAGQLDALQHDMAGALADSATRLAQQIVRSELATRPELVADVAHQALDALMLSARHITLRVHPDDQPLVAQGAGDVLAARAARLIADASIERGGCRVDSDIGHVDASIESRWRRCVAALGSERAWNDAQGSAPGPGDSSGRADESSAPNLASAAPPTDPQSESGGANGAPASS